MFEVGLVAGGRKSQILVSVLRVPVIWQMWTEPGYWTKTSLGCFSLNPSCKCSLLSIRWHFLLRERCEFPSHRPFLLPSVWVNLAQLPLLLGWLKSSLPRVLLWLQWLKEGSLPPWNYALRPDPRDVKSKGTNLIYLKKQNLSWVIERILLGLERWLGG